MSAFFYVVLFCVDRDFAMGRSPFRGVLPKCLKLFMVSEVNSESKQGRGTVPLNAQQICFVLP
jgi:hypothetical protein